MGCGSSVKRDTMESGNLQEYLGKQIPNVQILNNNSKYLKLKMKRLEKLKPPPQKSLTLCRKRRRSYFRIARKYLQILLRM
jgi:hypothetical protein